MGMLVETLVQELVQELHDVAGLNQAAADRAPSSIQEPSMLEPAELIGALIPAVPVPFDALGKIDALAQQRYAEWMARQPVKGVAVWAHTGRGLPSLRPIVSAC